MMTYQERLKVSRMVDSCMIQLGTDPVYKAALMSELYDTEARDARYELPSQLGHALHGMMTRMGPKEWLKVAARRDRVKEVSQFERA
jgi:hypothetical protein